MKALIFAAGLGTRLRPLTDSRPKALVDVGGEPMLGRVIRSVVRAGATSVTVNVHHFAPMVIEWLSSRDFGVPVSVSDESSLLLDTGGGLLKARPMLDDGSGEPILIHNADILTDAPLRQLAEGHRASGSDVTLMVSPRQSSRALLFDSAMNLAGWLNRTSEQTIPEDIRPADFTELAFSGVHMVSPGVFPALAQYAENTGAVFPIVPFYLSMIGRLTMRGWIQPKDSDWFDIGRPESLMRAKQYVENQSNLI